MVVAPGYWADALIPVVAEKREKHAYTIVATRLRVASPYAG